MNRKHALESIFRAGLSAVKTDQAIRNHVHARENILTIMDTRFDLNTFKRIVIAGAGKGCAPMAAALQDLLGHRIDTGLIVVKYGHGLTLDRIEVIEAAHPVPDENSLLAGKRILQLAESLSEQDLFICLLTGGASSLLVSPQSGVSLSDLQTLNARLLSCGADIHEMNALRKHVSCIKGGALTRAASPATVISLVVSDVVGDDLSTIASGPTTPDSSTYRDCADIIDKYNLGTSLPASVLKAINDGLNGHIPETPGGNDPAFSRTHNHIIANNEKAVHAAFLKATELGYHPHIFSTECTGESREVGQKLIAFAVDVQKTGSPAKKPTCIIAGGETTVSMTRSGKGGRNQELALSMALALKSHTGIYALAAGTDGSDGPTDAAGAFVFPDTCERGRAAGLDLSTHLRTHDAYPAFKTLDDLFITGPTLTNVMDIVVILVTDSE